MKNRNLIKNCKQNEELKNFAEQTSFDYSMRNLIIPLTLFFVHSLLNFLLNKFSGI
jgi:hypothetical protein